MQCLQMLQRSHRERERELSRMLESSDQQTPCCRYSKVGLLRKLLAETSRERAEWILWIDADTIIQVIGGDCICH